ncbi:hypothetical protein RUM43_009236 [Polyplax serrata]|uniref:Uncharacterized protein n=1 Tax=Polyplax serrata TaxID=468196 RepID=A0AAN8PW30_POLSC
MSQTSSIRLSQAQTRCGSSGVRQLSYGTAYNAVPTTHSTMNQQNCAFMVDNEAIYDISCERLGNVFAFYVQRRLQVYPVGGDVFLTLSRWTWTSPE